MNSAFIICFLKRVIKSRRSKVSPYIYDSKRMEKWILGDNEIHQSEKGLLPVKRS